MESYTLWWADIMESYSAVARISWSQTLRWAEYHGVRLCGGQNIMESYSAVGRISWSKTLQWADILESHSAVGRTPGHHRVRLCSGLDIMESDSDNQVKSFYGEHLSHGSWVFIVQDSLKILKLKFVF